MSLVWRKIQRANKKSSKYLFTITPQELLIVGTSKLEPESVVLVCMHRRRRVESKQRKWEGNFADPHRSLMVWPSPATDPLRIETTLYGDVVTGEYDDKDWTVVVEEITHKHKRHPIAAINLNMRLFVQSSSETRVELKLKLRPLRSDIIQCLLQALITSHLVSENDKTTQSEVSSVSEEKAVIADVKPRKMGSLPDEKSLLNNLPIEEDPDQHVKIVKTTTTGEESDLNITKETVRVGRQESVKSTEKEKEVYKPSVPIISASELSSSQPQPNAASLSLLGSKHSCTILAKNESKISDFRISNAAGVSEKNQTPKAGTKQVESVDKKLEEQKGADVSSAKSEVEGVKAVSESIAEEIEQSTPAPVEGEDLLSWCQRVTRDYKFIKITDFRKSFRSGLGFCAIVHRYRPGLIGEYEQLNFTDRGRKENYAKAIAAARILGVKRNLDLNQMMVLSPEANEENVRLFLSSLREVLDGKSVPISAKSLKTTEHRRSASYNISESEALVMRELENLRKQREEEEAVDYSDVVDSTVQLSSTAKSINFNEEDIGQQKEVVFTTDDETVSGDQALLDGTFGSNDYLITGLVSPTVATRHEELKKKRQTLNSPVLETSNGVDKERAKRLRKEARRLMEDAALGGKTTLLNSSLCQPVASTSTEANISLRTFRSEPKNDFHCLEMVTPQVNIYKFKKVEASPSVQRKKYEAPLIPAFQLPSQRISTSSSDVRNPIPTTFDRVRRYGSMRSQELAETVAKMAGLSPVAVPSTSSTKATPTRKLVSRWEKYNSNVEKIQQEQKRVSARLAEVSKKDEELSELTKSAATSDEEENLLKEHMQLLVEKDALVRRGESLNVLEQLADVESEIAELQKELGRTSSSEGVRTKEDKDSIDKMMEGLVELVNRKDQLSQKLIMLEAEDEEMDDRDRRTLEAAAHFKRGFEQPISASKRLITWFRS